MEYKGCAINGLTRLPALIYRPALPLRESLPVTRPNFVQAAAEAVAAAPPRRFGVIASCIVAGAILSAAGAQVQIHAADIAEPDQLAAVLAAVPDTAPLGAVIHTAATLADAVITTMTTASRP